MVLVITFALVGAVLGAYLRPRPLAIVIAIGVPGGLRGMLSWVAGMIGQPDDPAPWQVMVAKVAADPVSGYLPVIAAGAGGAVIAAVLCVLLEKEGQSLPFWMPQEGGVRTRDRTGRYKRLANMVEDRPLQSEAERRLHAAHEGYKK
jgi:hypothetical protein